MWGGVSVALFLSGRALDVAIVIGCILARLGRFSVSTSFLVLAQVPQVLQVLQALQVLQPLPSPVLAQALRVLQVLQALQVLPSPVALIHCSPSM
jgi:hypothetical protein